MAYGCQTPSAQRRSDQFSFVAGLGWKFRLWELGKKLEKASRMEKKMEPPPPLKELSPANLKVLYSYGEVLSDKELGCLVEELVQEGSTMSRWASWWTTGHGGEVEGDVSQ